MKKLNRFYLSMFVATFAAFSTLSVAPQALAVDISATPTSFQMSSLGLWKTLPVAVGVTVVAGNIVVVDTSTNTLKLASATTLGSSVINNIGGGGVALGGGGPGQQVSFCYSDPAFTWGGTVGLGSVVYLSNTAGGATSTYADLTSGKTVVVMGVGNATGNKINLNPTMGGAIP